MNVRSQSKTVTGAAGLTLGALVLAACGGNAEKEGAVELDPDTDITKQSIVVSNYESYMPEDMPARFAEATGSSMDVTYHASNEEIVAKVTTGADPGIDVAFINGTYAQALAEQGLLEPIDPDLVPNLKNLYPEAKELPYDPGNKISVPYAWGTTGLCYRSDLLNFTPTSWNDLLDPRPELVNKTTMTATERWLVLPALKSLGYSANTTDKQELDEAKELLIKTKGTLLAYDDATFYQRLISGEASLVEAWDGWCNFGIAENKDIKFVVPEEGSDLWVDVMVIFKTSKNKEAAHAFINEVLDPDTHTWVVENILYKAPNKTAMEQLPAELYEQYPNLSMTVDELFQQEPLVDVGEAATVYTDISTELSVAE
ncbi:MAG: polyamine ABC transporter substrate-binding protein [Nocardioides sp.]